MKFAGLIEQRERTLLQIEEEQGLESVELAPGLEALGYMYHALGRLLEARTSYERALTLRLRAGQNNTEAILKPLHALGLIFRLQEQFEQSEIYYKRALFVSIVVYGLNHAETCKRQNYLAGLYYAQRRYNEAEALILASAGVYQDAGGEFVAAEVLCQLALSLISFRRGEPGKAEEYLSRSTLLLQRCPPPVIAGDDVSHDLLQFVGVQLRQGAIDEAEATFRFIIIGETKGLWPRHPSMAKNLKHLGDLHSAFHRPERAAVIYRQSLSMYMDSVGTADPEIAELAEALGDCLVAVGRAEEAVEPRKIAQEMRALLGKRVEIG